MDDIDLPMTACFVPQVGASLVPSFQNRFFKKRFFLLFSEEKKWPNDIKNFLVLLKKAGKAAMVAPNWKGKKQRDHTSLDRKPKLEMSQNASKTHNYWSNSRFGEEKNVKNQQFWSLFINFLDETLQNLPDPEMGGNGQDLR